MQQRTASDAARYMARAARPAAGPCRAVEGLDAAKLAEPNNELTCANADDSNARRKNALTCGNVFGTSAREVPAPPLFFFQTGPTPGVGTYHDQEE